MESNSQGRGNSGVMIYGDYEVQILDSYENRSYADGQAGALYGQTPPMVNSSRAPGAWQTYDIIFEAPRWKDGELTKKAHVTVIHNGVVIHHRKEYIGRTIHRRVGVYDRPHEPRGLDRSPGSPQPDPFPQRLDPGAPGLRQRRLRLLLLS